MLEVQREDAVDNGVLQWFEEIECLFVYTKSLTNSTGI